jgi:hypothetical protein
MQPKPSRSGTPIATHCAACLDATRKGSGLEQKRVGSNPESVEGGGLGRQVAGNGLALDQDNTPINDDPEKLADPLAASPYLSRADRPRPGFLISKFD